MQLKEDGRIVGSFPFLKEYKLVAMSHVATL